MRPIQPQRRRSSAGFWLGLVLLLTLGLGGVAAVLAFMGVNLNPWAEAAEDPFMVRIPINSVAIPAYAKVEREHLLNPATRGLMHQKVPPQSVVGMSISGISSDLTPVDGRVDAVRNDNGTVVFIVGEKEVPQSQVSELGGALMNINAILGRVVRKDKRAGMGFQESVFFPKGTPEGIAGATPPGMKAVTLDATKLTGIHALNSGDRLDLLASVPAGEASAFQANSGGPLPSALLTGSAPTSGSKITEPILLAQNALLLRPVSVRNEATSTSSLTSGKRLVNEPKYEVTIAVTPDDVIPLQGALDRGLAITCVATSMQPADASAEEPVTHDEDQLLIPVTVRPIPAYAVVTREAFVNPATRRIRMEPVSKRQVDQLQVTVRLEDMLGAIARHDIPAGSFVRQSDLLQAHKPNPPGRPQDSTTVHNSPKSATDTNWQPVSLSTAAQQDEGAAGANVVGDRPAIPNFIPPGYTAVAIPWNRMYGSEHLQIDDHLDLLASYPLERKRDVNERETRGEQNVVAKEYEEFISRGTDRTRDESLAERGEPWFIATNAVVIGPVGFPAPGPALRAIGNANTPGNNADRMSGPAILIAIDNRDLENVAMVLNTPDVLLSVAIRGSDSVEAPEGYREIAVAPVDIPAFSEFSDLHWKGLRREVAHRLVRDNDPRFADAVGVDRIDQFYGRTLKVAKSRFAAFSPDDFLPEGAEPGVVAGIGPNSVVVNVVADQVQALNRFHDNDEVAVLLTGNVETPPTAVIHATSGLGPGSRVVVQSARVVRSASDVSDTIALEISRTDVAAFTAALFAHDATDSGEKHSQRLMAVALHRVPETPDIATDQIPRSPIPDHLPLKSAPQVYEILGGQSRTHFFATSNEVVR
ncbi:MAG: hypothetical protein R3C59_13865 [Planctomycetaceae bacterium]